MAATCKQNETFIKRENQNDFCCNNILLYCEYKPQVSVVNLTLRWNKSCSKELNISVDQNTITIYRDNASCVFALGKLELLPMSCRGLEWNRTGDLQLTIQVKEDVENIELEDHFRHVCHIQEDICDRIKDSKQICMCSSCGEKILREDGAFSRVLPLPSENWSDLADFWFCHRHGDEDHSVPTIAPKDKDCLVGNLHILIPRSYLKSTTVQSRCGVLHCLRCDSVIGLAIENEGRQSKQGSSAQTECTKHFVEMCHIYLHAVTFGGKSLNDNPSTAFRDELFLNQLLQEQSRLYTSFRFLVESKKSLEKNTIRLLVWLIEQDVHQYLGEGCLQLQSSSLLVTGRKITKVLYRCIVDGDDQTCEPSGSCDKFLLCSWMKDNTVHGLTLPRPLCLQLVSILLCNTKQLPRTQRHLNGFHVSYLLKENPRIDEAYT